MGSVKKWFGGGGGGSNAAAEAEARRLREQQERERIERENKLMLEGSVGSTTSESAGNVQTGYSEYDTGGGKRRRRGLGENMSSSLGIG